MVSKQIELPQIGFNLPVEVKIENFVQMIQKYSWNKAANIKRWSDLPFSTKRTLVSLHKREEYKQVPWTFSFYGNLVLNDRRVELPLTRHEFKRVTSYQAYCFQTFGVLPSDRFSVVYYPLPQIISIAAGVIELGACFVAIEGTQEKVFEQIVDKKITVLFATPAFIDEFLNFLSENRLKSSLRLMISSGQKIISMKKFKAKIVKSLKCKYVDDIGCAEIQHFAYTCPTHDYFHFIDREMIIEVIDPESGDPAEEGELVITPLWKNEVPLVRFRTGDYLKLERARCKCANNNSFVFRQIIKRVDSLSKLNGVRVDLAQLQRSLAYDLVNQYWFDTRLWKNRYSPLASMVVYKQGEQDRVLLLIDAIACRLTLRNVDGLKKRIEQEFSLTPKIEFVSRMSAKLMRDLKLIDLRVVDAKTLPVRIQKTILPIIDSTSKAM